MTKMFFELAAFGLCPLIFAVSAWMIAIKALTWTDEISEVVRALTGLDEEEKTTNVEAGRLPRRSEIISYRKA